MVQPNWEEPEQRPDLSLEFAESDDSFGDDDADTEELREQLRDLLVDR